MIVSFLIIAFLAIMVALNEFRAGNSKINSMIEMQKQSDLMIETTREHFKSLGEIDEK